MIHIAICDDEKIILDSLGQLISEFLYKKNIKNNVSLFFSGEELLQSEDKIDLLFLDIRMGRMNGMETARKMRDRGYRGEIIFITILKEMVFQSFEVRAFDYLLKPLKENDFEHTMERLLISMKRAEEGKLFIQRGMENHIIPFDEIWYCEVIDRKIYLHLDSGEIMDYYDRMDHLLDFLHLYLLNILEIMTGFYFFNRFLGRKTVWIHYIFFGVAALTLTILFPGSGILKSALYVVLFILDGILAGKYNSAFYAFVIVVVIYLCNGIVNSLCGIFAPSIPISDPLTASTVFMAISFLFSYSLTLLCYKMIAQLIHEDAGEKIYSLLFLFPILLILLVSEYIGSELSDNTVTVEAGKIISHTNSFPLLFVQILGATSLFGILYAYKKLQEGFRLQKEMCLLEQESHFLHQYVEEAGMRYEKTRSFRHDIKNHIMVVEELLHQGLNNADKGETALRYLTALQGMTEEMAFPVSTGRPVLDILLGNKLGLAENLQIGVECSLTVPESCEVSDIDFCIILSNTMDNAINACHRMCDNERKFIHITSRQQGAFYMIRVANSYDGAGDITWGTGLSNIRTTVEKYQGVVEVQAGDKEFILSMLLGIADEG